MARTLIGNIKGKDGRGISKIEKTATTGVVDTYTITYTDSTTSTFTINNSDSISLQRQIVPSAAVESSATASQAYTAGDYVVVNGALRKVKSAIAKGDTIGDSNSTATTVTGELATLGDSVSPVKRQVFDDLLVEGFKRGGCVTIHISGSNSLTRSKNPIKVAELADGCAPRVRVMTLFGVKDSAWGMVRVDTDGRVYLTHMYGQDEIVWTKFDVSVTFAAV